jgi:hypothetical protein
MKQILQKINGIGTSKKDSREQSGVKSLESFIAAQINKIISKLEV